MSTLTARQVPTGTHWRALLLLEAARGWTDRDQALRLVPAATTYDLDRLEVMLATRDHHHAYDEAERIAAYRPDPS